MVGVDAPPRPDAESATAPGSGHSQPGSPRAELRGRAGPGRTPGSRTRPPGPAGGGIGRGPAWAQPPWSSGRRSFGSWRGAPWGGCTGEPGGVPGRVRMRMPPFHLRATDRGRREATPRHCVGRPTHLFRIPSCQCCPSTLPSSSSFPPPPWSPAPRARLFFGIMCSSLFSGSLSTCLLGLLL